MKRIQKNAKKKVETVLREERWRDKSWDELGSSRDSTQPQGGVINQTFGEKHLRFIHILIQIYSCLDESTCGNVNIRNIKQQLGKDEDGIVGEDNEAHNSVPYGSDTHLEEDVC